MRLVPCTSLALAVLLTSAAGRAQDPDRDRDGLSDFRELQKHRTDPTLADSDGDGKPDGDWQERREYAYTVRAVVRVMRPVTPAFLTDDWQDARVLAESPTSVVLEVVLYPYATADSAIAPDPDWRARAKEPSRWLASGPTCDHDTALRDRITSAMASDGIDLAALDDEQVVRRASRWLLARADCHDGFSTFVTSFDAAGRPFVAEALRDAVERDRAASGWSQQEQWERELSARGMFRHGSRGSCTSTAIYLCGCLRAIGVPTRIVLGIPVIDAGDPREVGMVRTRIQNHRVRAALEEGLAGLESTWASHTFDEILVGGRWRRLDGDRLGAGILDVRRFGLITSIATFADWADADMPTTIGTRQALHRYDNEFGGRNPYSTLELDDAFGVHAEQANARVETRLGRIVAVHWSDAGELPAHVRENLSRTERFGLVAMVRGVGDAAALRSFLALADPRVFLERDGWPTLGIAFDPDCWWMESDHAWMRIAFDPDDRRDLASGLVYRLRLRNEREFAQWRIDDETARVNRAPR